MATTRPYTNLKPSAYDGLGEIDWEIGDTHCNHCHATIPAADIETPTRWYDGCMRQQPTCPHCQYPLKGGLPIDPTERAIIEAERA